VLEETDFEVIQCEDGETAALVVKVRHPSLLKDGWPRPCTFGTPVRREHTHRCDLGKPISKGAAGRCKVLFKAGLSALAVTLGNRARMRRPQKPLTTAVEPIRFRVLAARYRQQAECACAWPKEPSVPTTRNGCGLPHIELEREAGAKGGRRDRRRLS
jgi:hypothetical protein